MKKYILTLVCLCVFGTVSLGYSDVVGDKYEKSIDMLSGMGIISGYENGMYLPDRVISRAEMAKLLVSSTGGLNKDDMESSFNDVKGHWAEQYISTAVSRGYIAGYPDGSFKPNDAVTYNEAITMSVRALGYTKLDGSWPTNYVEKANSMRMLETIDGVPYVNAVQRNVVAQLLWNMFNSNMDSSKVMMEVYYPNYVTSGKVNYLTNLEMEDFEYVNENIMKVNVLIDGKEKTFEYVLTDFSDIFKFNSNFSILYSNDMKVVEVYTQDQAFFMGKLDKVVDENAVVVSGVKYAFNNYYAKAGLEGKYGVVGYDRKSKSISDILFIDDIYSGYTTGVYMANNMFTGEKNYQYVPIDKDSSINIIDKSNLMHLDLKGNILKFKDIKPAIQYSVVEDSNAKYIFVSPVKMIAGVINSYSMEENYIEIDKVKYTVSDTIDFLFKTASTKEKAEAEGGEVLVNLNVTAYINEKNELVYVVLP